MSFNPDPTNAQVLAWMVAKHPGSTEVELANRMFGDGAYQQRINSDTRWLEARGLIRREVVDGIHRLYRVT